MKINHRMLWSAIKHNGFIEIRCAFLIGSLQGNCSQAVFDEHVSDMEFVKNKINMVYWHIDKFLSENSK